MAIVHIRIHGREYDIACDDGQEEHLRFLADEVDERVRALAYNMGGNPGEAMGLLLTSLTMADELIESKREIERITAEVRRIGTLVDDDKKLMSETRMVEIENAMATTLEEIASRIERIADQAELR
jgi:cell division protein ZapA